MERLQQRSTSIAGNSREEKEMRYDNILFLLDNLEKTKTKTTILHKEKRLNNILRQMDIFWENHPNWTNQANQTKTMRNLIYQLENRKDEFINCFPKTIFQTGTINEPRLILVLADKSFSLEEINKTIKLMKAITDIEDIIKPIRIILNWNKVIERIENQLN